MKKNIMKLNKSFVLILTILLTLMMSFVFIGGTHTVLATSNLKTSQVKEYWNGTIDEDFDDSSVLVVMDKQSSDINKRHDDSFFGNFSKEAIYDLTFTNIDTKNINRDNFNQILQIKLAERSKENVVEVIRELEKIDGILWAGPNHYEHPALQPPSAITPPAGVHRYPLLWGLHGNRGIQAEEAWNFTTSVYNNVRVGVIDSGMDNHPDIAANRTNEGGDFVNMTNIHQNIPGPLRADPDGHGTHVAGTIGATGVNPNGITGVAWNVQLIPLQVSFWHSGLSEWLWDVAAVTRAINWARDNDVDVINYSGGGTNDNVARRIAIEEFQGLFICAAGNNYRSNENNEGTNRLYYPADYSRNQTFSNRVISVGAINNVGNRANFSNWGATSVSIFAPGTGIWSSVPNAIDTSGYVSWQGTSMATPHVTGTAALMYSLYTQMGSGLTRSQKAVAIKTAILNNAVLDSGFPLSGLCVSNGRLNAFRALSSIAFNYTNIGTNELRINSLNFNHNGHLLIHESINGRIITQIGSTAFSNRTQLTNITIPSTITHIGSDAFKNTNDAAIYLEGKTSVPNTFNAKWNLSNNPVFLNGVKCLHNGTKTRVSLDSEYHADLCDKCRTVTNVNLHRKYNLNCATHCYDCSYQTAASHVLGAPYTPIYSPYPYGIKKHNATCSLCGKQKEMPCISEYQGPYEDTYCGLCGRLMTPAQGVLYTITMPNDKVYVSSSPITFETFKSLVESIGHIGFEYKDYSRLTQITLLIKTNAFLEKPHIIIPKTYDIEEYLN